MKTTARLLVLATLLTSGGCDGGTSLRGDAADADALADPSGEVDAAGDADDGTAADADANDGADADARPDACIPSCVGRECGDDGCGGDCPSRCTAFEVCRVASGECIAALGWVEVPAKAVPFAFDRKLVFDAARRVVVFLGRLESEMTMWEYGGTTWAEVVLPVLPSPRSDFALAYDSTRAVVVLFGGRGTTSLSLSDTWEYDGSAWTEVSTPTSPPARYGHAMAYDSARGVTVAVGGCTTDASGFETCLDDTWEYDGATWTASPASLPSPVSFTSVANRMAYDESRGVVVLLGRSDSGTPGTWEYDGTAWTEVLPAASSPDGRALLWYDEGRGATVVLVRPWDSVTSSATWEYDGAAWTEVATGSFPADDFQGLAYDLDRGVAVLLGVNSTWEGDGATWSVVATATWPPAGDEPAFAYDPLQVGVDLFLSRCECADWIGCVCTGDLWRYGGAGWSDVVEPLDPFRPVGPAMSFDAMRGVLVLFGGEYVDPWGPGPSDDTLQFDGTAWTLVDPPRSPSARTDSAMAYDAARGASVLFGGTLFDAYGDASDTWEYRDGSWVETTPPTSPAARHAHALAYDSARGVTVLFGGSGSSELLGDTWEYRDGSWVETTPSTSPPARFAHALAYDSVRGVTVLFGGERGGEQLADTWEYDGSGWTRIETPHAPSARKKHALSFDPSSGLVMLFGGVGGGDVLGDTWEYRGP
jgi:hypothetical protein